MTADLISKKAVLVELKKSLDNGYSGTYQDLLAEIFDDASDERFADPTVATKAVEEFGIDQAMQAFRDYEEKESKKINISIMDEIDMADMLWYVIAKQTISETFGEQLRGFATEEKNRNLIAEINKKLDE